jgi:hypothetical protein
MLKLVSKFAMDIFPSVIATIIGAYIVNHYINNKTPADAAAAVSTADPKKAASKTDSKPAERSADIGNIPESGVRAKGVAEKTITDKSAEKPADKPAEKADKPAERADKPSETASIPPTTPAESRRHQPAGREKAAKVAPAPVPVPPPVETAVAAPNTAPPAETGPDANDLARAAIERLHRASVASQPRAPEQPRVVATPAADPVQLQAPPVPLQPLPPPIMVSTPPADMKPPPAPRTGDTQRPTPPADIPFPSTPIDLRADAVDSSPPPPQGRSSVAEDMLSAAKSVFHSVLPK